MSEATADGPQAVPFEETRTVEQLAPGLALRAVWLRAALLLSVLVSLVTAAHEVLMLGLIQMIDAGDPGVVERAELIDVVGAVGGFGLLASLVLNAIAYCYWVNRAARIAWLTHPEEMTVSPTWAAAWNFIPIASLWMPFAAASQIWRAARKAEPGASADRPLRMWVWWLAWVASNLLGNVSTRVGGFEPNLEELRITVPLDLAGSVLLLLASLMLLPIVSEITAALRRRGAADVFD
ncbi:MAG: DUF4328 domain-containing protein [Pseudomonadota bacterium]